MPRTTLLLNASYEPLSVISWQRAMTMFFLEKVEVVAEYEDRDVRSVSCTFRMPSIVRLLTYVKRRYFGIKFSRQNIYSRDAYTCQYCGKKAPQVELSLDHVVPRVRGGNASWENIVTCCVRCNRRKGGNTPEDAGMKLLSKPYKPSARNSIPFALNRTNTPQSWLEYFS